MNFLLRSAQPIAVEQPSLNDFIADGTTLSRPLTTLEGLASDDPFPRYDVAEDCIGVGDVAKGLDGTIAGPSTRTDAPGVDKHIDVSEDEGWITIPCNEIPEDWKNSLDTHSLRALDRNFVFPGEQVRILAYLSSYEQETEVITPFKVAAVMSRNGIGQTSTKEKENGGDGIDSVSGNGKVDQDKQNVLQNGNTPSKGKADRQQDIAAGASLLRKEDQKRKTARLVQRLKSSYFFVRIAESGEMLWSKKGASKKSLESSDLDDQGSATNGASKSAKEVSDINTIVDKGNFNANVSGGVARNNVQCCSLANGDVVVLLQINVGVDLLSDPVIEILQFEKHQSRTYSLKNHGDLLHAAEDPSGGLLTWLLPVENTLPPPTVRPPSPPPALGSPGIGSTSGRSNFSAASSGSQIFSFGNLRSYSMSAIPQSSIPPSTAIGLSSKSNSFDIGEWDQFSKQKPVTSENTSKEELLSFRTVSLEPERFSVRCGLEGIYIPGRRWRRKLEIIQPIQIQSFAADCNSDDLLCVQIKNVSPAHIPGVVIYIDSITIVLDEAAKGGGPPLSFPIASVEPGEDYGLPNLALRRDEEHSFILKPAISAWKKLSTQDRSTVSSQPPTKTASTLLVSSKIVEEKSSSLPTDQYAVVVSCHCNYSESRLFFKQPSSWRPHISRDIMISVAAEMTPEPNANASQLPVQVLTLQASNLTPEDLTMTILAPASFTSPPTVVSLNSSPSSPLSPVFGLAEFQGTENHKKSGSTESKSISSKDQVASVPDAILNNDVGCTHLWLHSRVPLGCVPSQTTATIKLEVLPLTDGIITLDTLQIDVKEKGVTYVPEHSLKINATWSISTGIV